MRSPRGDQKRSRSHRSRSRSKDRSTRKREDRIKWIEAGMGGRGMRSPRGDQKRSRSHRSRSRSKDRSIRKQTQILTKHPGHQNLLKYYCEICDVYASGQTTYDLHLNGRKHKEELTKTNISSRRT